MSFDFWFQRFRGGQEAVFSRRALEATFAGLETGWSEDDLAWSVKTGEDEWADFYVKRTDDIRGFMISRPPYGPDFWNRVHSLLREVQGVLYWNGGGLVACADALSDLHPNIRELISDPPVASCGQDILDAIEGKGRWRPSP
jgi:hypothetical protein